MPSGVEDLDIKMRGGREVRRGWSVGSTVYVGSREEGLQLVFCCSVGIRRVTGFEGTESDLMNLISVVYREHGWSV